MIPKKERRGFQSVRDNINDYDLDLKNLGYDYTETLLTKTMSPYMFKNPKIANFLNGYVRKILILLINNVKYLRIFYNYSVPKKYTKIN